MTMAEAIITQFLDEWKARCPKSPLLSSESHLPFENAVARADAAARVQSRHYIFHDGSSLELSTDANGLHSVSGHMAWKG